LLLVECGGCWVLCVHQLMVEDCDGVVVLGVGGVGYLFRDLYLRLPSELSDLLSRGLWCRPIWSSYLLSQSRLPAVAQHLQECLEYRFLAPSLQ
jgi:hypothetical protein